MKSVPTAHKWGCERKFRIRALSEGRNVDEDQIKDN